MTRRRRDTVRDVWGRLWRVREVRPTAHGWPLYLGYPDGGGGRGRPRVVLTARLRRYLREHRDSLGSIRLPISQGLVAHLRRLLDHEPATRPQAPAERAPHWWLAPEHIRRLCAERPLYAIAAEYGLSEGWVAVLRRRLRRLGHAPRRTGGTRRALPAVPQVPPRTPEEVRDSLAGELVTCLECGAPMRWLLPHLRAAHALDRVTYCTRWGLPPGTVLAGRAMRERQSSRLRAEHAGRRGGGPPARTERAAEYYRAWLAHRRGDPAPMRAWRARYHSRPLGRRTGRADRAAWWLDRAGDLLALSAREFSARHRTPAHTAAAWRAALCGPRPGRRDWWQRPAVRAAVAAHAAPALLGRALGIPIGAARILRRLVRTAPAG